MTNNILIILIIIVSSALLFGINTAIGVLVGAAICPVLLKLRDSHDISDIFNVAEEDDSPSPCPMPQEGFEGREIMQPDIPPAPRMYNSDAEAVIKQTGDCSSQYPPRPFQGQWGTDQGYTDCYKPIAMEFSNDPTARKSMDEKSMTYGQMAGARAKKVIDGAVSRNAYYFKKNFSDELEKYEKKRWWGNSEY